MFDFYRQALLSTSNGFDQDKFMLLSAKNVAFFERHSAHPCPASGIFVTVCDAPLEMSNELIANRLEEYGMIHSIRNQI